MRLRPSLALVLLVACGSAEPAAERTVATSSPAPQAPPAGQSSSDAPRSLPTSLMLEVGIPGRPEWWVNARLQLDSEPWRLVGCIGQRRAVACEQNTTIEVSADEQRELVALLDEIQAPIRCEPEGFAPGDPEYAIRGSWSREGHLPADPAAVEARTQGPCGAPARLAWWVARRLSR